MEDKKVLPIRKGIIDSYCINSSLCSIARTDEDLEVWLTNNFIQIFYEKEYDCFHYLGTHLLQYNCPFIKHEEVGRDIVTQKWRGNLICMLKEMIDMERYIFLFVDFAYLHTVNYKEAHIVHEIFIYGYDNDKQVFLCANHDATGKYMVYEESYSDIENGYWNVQDYHHQTSIELFKYTEHKDEYNRIDKSLIKRSMKDFLESEYVSVCRFPRTFITGLNALKFELERIKNLPSENFLDIRIYHLLFEHKKIMLERIRIMDKYEMLSNSDIHNFNYNRLKDDYLILRTLALKYNIRKEKNTLKKIIEMFTDLINREEVCMHTILKQIND